MGNIIISRLQKSTSILNSYFWEIHRGGFHVIDKVNNDTQRQNEGIVTHDQFLMEQAGRSRQAAAGRTRQMFEKANCDQNSKQREQAGPCPNLFSKIWMKSSRSNQL